MKALEVIAPGNIPAFAKSLCKFRSVDFAAVPEVETSDRAFQSWLQEHTNLGQVQLLYCSPVYKAFIKVPFVQQFRLAKKSPGNRGEFIRVLLESVKVG